MALIGALTGAIGLINSINQNKAAAARQREADAQQAQALQAQKDYMDRLMASYQQAEASGEFNSAGREAQLNSLFKNALNTNLDNTNVSLRNAGYRPGDSSFEVQDKNIAEKNALGLSSSILDARDKANALRLQALQSTNPAQYAGALTNASNINYQRGYNMYNDPSQLINNLATNPVFKPRTGATTPGPIVQAGMNDYVPGSTQMPNGSYRLPEESNRAY